MPSSEYIIYIYIYTYIYIHIFVYIYIYIYAAPNRWLTKLVGWDFFFDYIYIVPVVAIMPC